VALAENSVDLKKKLSEKGVKMPRVGSGMNKYAQGNMRANEEGRSNQKVDLDLEEVADLLYTAKKRFRYGRTQESTNREEGIEDLKFLKGSQWSSADATSRAAEGRPCITENRLPTFANQITNDQRQNRPAINISPMGGKAGRKDAKILRGMIRAIERDCNADIAYDTGFASAVHNGWGFWRIRTEYESEDSFDMVIVIDPIENPMNVVADPTKRGLKKEWCFITEMVPREDFERDYPDADQMPWSEVGVSEADKDWITQEEIRVAEYYYTAFEKRDLVMLDNGFKGWEDELDDLVKQRIKNKSLDVVTRRSVQCTKIKWCKLTANEVLEERELDGQYIPVIECDGTRVNVNGKVSKKGIIRDAKGPQSMINYYKTLEAENVALQPKAPWIMEEGQVEGHEDKWRSANKRSFSYLLYKGTNIGGKAAPPPQRQPFAGPPAAILEAQKGNIEAMKAVTGIRFDATMSERMSDESGRAIRELNKNANLGAYHYIDNYGRALKETGAIMIDLIPHTYDTKRMVAVLDDAGADESVMINPNLTAGYGESQTTHPDGHQGVMKMFNPKVGRYQVTVTVGPSYATKRIEASASQMEFAKAMPMVASHVADLIAKNSDWEGAEEFATRLAKMLPPNLITPERSDMSPQIQALIQSLNGELQKAQQQMAAMAKELQDHDKDRDVMYEKIAKDFEAKMAGVMVKIEEVQAKKEATLAGTLGRAMQDIVSQVKNLEQSMKQERTGA
jgi:Skp family chaperone for outer membrane proteins